MLRLQMILELPKFRELFPAELAISVGLFALLLLVDMTDMRGDIVAVEESFVTDAALVVAFASVRFLEKIPIYVFQENYFRFSINSPYDDPTSLECGTTARTHDKRCSWQHAPDESPCEPRDVLSNRNSNRKRRMETRGSDSERT
jgi:hypothetical protein